VKEGKKGQYKRRKVEGYDTSRKASQKVVKSAAEGEMQEKKRGNEEEGSGGSRKDTDREL